MWSLRKKFWGHGSRVKMFAPILLLLFVPCSLSLISCGFEPMYGEAAMQSSRTPLQGNLAIVSAGATHMDQVLKISLEDRFNPEGIKFASPDYRLEVTIIRNLISTVLKNDGTTQRYDVRFDSNFKLTRVGAKKPLLEGTMHRTASYNVAANANFATYEAEQDITERTLKELAEDYMLRLSGYFAGKPEQPDKPEKSDKTGKPEQPTKP
jgi:hypothetical protein